MLIFLLRPIILTSLVYTKIKILRKITIVGLSSLKKVDEIAILGVVLAAWAMFIPETVLDSIFPSWFTRRHFYQFMFIVTVLLTLACLYMPEVNHNV